MTELPDEIWNHILEFTLNWKESHKRKIKITLNLLDGMFKEIYHRWTPSLPAWKNTNDIIRQIYDLGGIIPRPNLLLTSITVEHCFDGWWCGYGLEKIK